MIRAQGLSCKGSRLNVITPDKFSGRDWVAYFCGALERMGSKNLPLSQYHATIIERRLASLTSTGVDPYKLAVALELFAPDFDPDSDPYVMFTYGVVTFKARRVSRTSGFWRALYFGAFMRAGIEAEYYWRWLVEMDNAEAEGLHLPEPRGVWQHAELKLKEAEMVVRQEGRRPVWAFNAAKAVMGDNA